MSEGVVRQWVRDFHALTDEVHDLQREERPKDSLISDAIAGVCNLLEEDQGLTIRQIEYVMHEECVTQFYMRLYTVSCVMNWL